MRVEIMWGEPQHKILELLGLAPDPDNFEIEAAARVWVETNVPDFDSWDWRKVKDDG